MKSFSENYKSAGVDITAGYKSVELMKTHIQKTLSKSVVSGIGGFGGLFELDLTGIEKPVLVSGTDGVGTKLKLAFILDKHDTVGIDCVAMCVNDIICCGAKPLYFLDYIATGKNYPEKIADIVKGVADGCVMADCSLIGGETAEMPGFYTEDEYDMAGFAVGVVDKAKILDNSKVKAGDVLIGIESSGMHSNGFSLVRKIVEINKENLNEYIPELSSTLGEALLTPTKIYVKPILDLISKVNIKSIANITGGGFYENIPRALPEGLSVIINKNSYDIPYLFKYLMEKGQVPERDMYNVFNMGIGMVLTCDKEDADNVLEILSANGEKAYILGEVVNGEEIIIK